MLLPEQSSRSESFAQLILDHSPNLVLASYSNAEGRVTGPESVQGLVTVALGRDKIEGLFGFGNLSADPDGVVRAMPFTYRDQRGKRVPSLAGRTAAIVMAGSSLDGGSDTRFFIDYAVDWPKFRRVSWKDASSVLTTTPEVFRDRIVLVGGEFAGSGDIHNVVRHRALPAEASGLVLQALALNTLLDGRRFTQSHVAFVVGLLRLASGIAILALLCLPRSGWTMAMAGAGGLLYIAFSFALFRWNRQLADRRFSYGVLSRDRLCCCSAPHAAHVSENGGGDHDMKPLPGAVMVALALHVSSSVVAFAATLQQSVAIVCFLSGPAFVRFDDGRTELRLFQRLRPGSAVETETGSKVVLAFFSGARYEFGEQALGTVGHAAIETKKGTIRELPAVPAMIAIAPSASEEKPGTRLAGTRIRGGDAVGKRVANLYPSAGAATFAHGAVVRFDPVEGYQRYRVEVEDETRNTVFAVETTATTVQISPNVLRPGAAYYWRVRTLDPEKPAMRGEAVFSALSEDNTRRRAALKASVDTSGDPSLLALLAELNRSVGLQWEACEELKAALGQSPGNGPMVEAVARFGCSKLEYMTQGR